MVKLYEVVWASELNIEKFIVLSDSYVWVSSVRFKSDSFEVDNILNLTIKKELK